MSRFLFALLPLFLLVALPFVLRPAAEKPLDGQTEKLVIVTPHPDSVKYELTRAFREHYRKRHGREIELDWRNVGGTSDIVRYINDRFEAAFRLYYTPEYGEWSSKTAGAFRNPKASTPDDRRVRMLFLESDVGIGIDLFFGGGSYDHARFASFGYGVDAGILQRHPEWFVPEVIPETFAGEQIRDSKGRFYGTCLSSFGICYNLDRLRDLSAQKEVRISGWQDLGDPGFFDAVAVADPTKSGSITKCFEMILQKVMADRLASVEKTDDPQVIADAWNEGFLLIKRIAANSRYLTDSAGKLVRDVSSGSIAAGMCIDFYGLSEAEWTNAHSGLPRIQYLMPVNGTAVTADPIQLLRGAPNPEAAKDFIEFLLSPEGQKLWFFKPGTPGGPEKYALRRPAVRRDLYTEENRPYRSDPDYNPYESAGTFRYRGELTGRYFNLIRVLIKVLTLEPMDDLRAAWRAILENGGPEKNPEAMAELRKMPFSYEEAATMSADLSPSESRSMAEVTALRRSWSDFASKQYRKAESLARKNRERTSEK